MTANLPNDEDIATMIRKAAKAHAAPLGLKESIRGRLTADRTPRRAGRRRLARVWLGPPGAVAAAAAVMVALVVWWLVNGAAVTRSAHAEARREMMEVLANSQATEWVHLQARGISGDFKYEAWHSFRPNRYFQRTGDAVSESDYEANRKYVYDPVTNTVTIKYLAFQDEANVASSYFELMTMRQKEDAQEGAAEITKSEAVVEGKTCAVFTVKYKGRGYQRRLVVDPEVQRIMRIEDAVLDPKAAPRTVTVIDVDYPESGPADIFALMTTPLSRDAKIVDETPPAELEAFKEKFIAARDGFAPSYYALVYLGFVDPRDGRYNPQEVDVIYKKGARYRIERYSRESGISHDEMRRRMPAEDMATLEAWTRTQPVDKLYFHRSDGVPQGTVVRLDGDGKLQKETSRLLGADQLIVEELVWGTPPQMENTTALPGKNGPWGPLVGWEHKRQAVCKKGALILFPSCSRWYYNVQRGYIPEERESLTDAQAPWQENKKWMDDIDADLTARVRGPVPNGEHYSLRASRVLEYAQTPQGQWYARKILDSGTSKRTETERPQWIRVIYVDTTRDIPDEMVDPDSVVSPDIFRPPQ